ncbi:MAG: SusD/RagB family nutrient-binding outer membrane lipoprotein [Sphingobacteriales bacterium]
MKIKSFIPFALLLTIGMVSITGCQKGNLIDNPNAASSTGVVPATLILNHLTAKLIRNDEQPFSTGSKSAQDVLSTYVYYFGNNNYNFGNTEDSYDILKYAIALQAQAGGTTNKYYALSQFFKAYAGIWLSERVGDIPFSQAGNVSVLTPKYDTQHDVYKSALAMLSTANSTLAPFATATPNVKLDAGDIYGLTYLQWQKVINTYTLRVLISLSKRATDNADLNIPSTFATIVNNPATYPIMTSNADNLVYKYNQAFNPYATLNLGLQPYNSYDGIGLPYLNATAPNADPRLLVVASPAISQVSGGTPAGSFAAFVGIDDNQSVSALQAISFNNYSHSNYNRYFSLPAAYSGANAEPFVFIGYSEMCFNIAEAINLGWVSGQNSTTWYNNGINASLALYGITNGQTLTIADYTGATLGTATVNIPAFMANVAYAGDNAAGLAQIFTQRYVSMHLNSGFESFFNWRRSVSSAYPNGIPAFSQGGAGIGTANNLIPRRWLYPATEANYNSANYNSAITSQFGGTDDPTKDTWLTK